MLGTTDLAIQKMHLYLRLLKENGVETYSKEEKRHIYDVLSRALGVEAVKGIQRHQKGGYAITLNISRESLDALIEYISAHGFILVL